MVKRFTRQVCSPKESGSILSCMKSVFFGGELSICANDDILLAIGGMNMKIVVLAGGLSPERDVSLSSGTMAANALLKKGHQAVLIDLFFGLPDWDGTDRIFENAHPLPPYRITHVEPDLASVRCQRKSGYNDYIGLNVLEICGKSDIVYMALHGDCGENGKLQKLFDSFSIRYTGSGPLACEQAMDKHLSKSILSAAGVLCPADVRLERGSDIDLAALPFPCAVKPNSGGSSIGVSIVTERSDLAPALELAFSMEPVILAEQYIKGRELSCGILGDRVLPPIEIIPKHGFYDYQNKYQPGSTEEIVPARLSPDETEAVQRLTRLGFDALGLEVYGRLDFLLTHSGEIYCLEANTLPGLTPVSLLPQEAAAVGIDYPTMCEMIIRLSLEKK